MATLEEGAPTSFQKKETIIKAIETEYKGYKFRSRLEARWAVFFDTAEIIWEYEPEGFELSEGKRYLPDFYLPIEELFVEVKGVYPNPDYIKMLEELAIKKNKNILLVVGICDEGESWHFSYIEKIWNMCLIVVNPFFNSKKNDKLFFVLHNGTSTERSNIDTLKNHYANMVKSKRRKCINAMKQARFEFQK